MGETYIVVASVAVLIAPAYVLLRNILQQIGELRNESRQTAVALAHLEGRFDNFKQE